MWELQTKMLGFQAHFISGLPRSGSTLLAALLRQNPKFRTTSATSPIYAMSMALIRQMGANGEFATFFNDDRRQRILRGLFESYHAPETGQLVFDTGRLWTRQMPLIASLYPKARVICCVRHVPWIIDSVEQLLRRNPMQTSALFDHAPNTALTTRIGSIMDQANGFVGAPLGALREAWFGAQASQLIVLQYESLAAHAAESMAALYQALGEPPSDHKFENIEHDEAEYDLRLGMPGLHRVRCSVRYLERKTILPPEVFRNYENSSFWLKANANINGVTLI